MSDASSTRRRGIQSVEIGMRVLTALASLPGPAALSAVAQAASLSASQTHRYLSSLITAGLARQQAATGLYDLDAGAIRIGLAALSRLDLFTSADAAFGAFARDTGRTCLVAVWGDLGPTVVRWFAGNPPVITSLAIGSIMPLLRSATGQVFFAFGDPAAMDTHAGREAGAHRTGADRDALRVRIRAACAARVQGALIPGLRAIGAPVFDLQGRLVLVATTFAGGAAERLADARAEAALKAACRSVTETLGGKWPQATTPASADRTPGRPRAPGPPRAR